MTSAAPEPGAAVRVASIPHADGYVDTVLPADAVAVGPPGTPSPWLDADFLEAHTGDVHVVHLHAGPEPLPAAGLERWTETVRRLGIPLVVTVHRLGCPGHPGAEDDRLAVVLGTAEVVLTLTAGAADAIAERYGRTAIVVAHPSPARPVPGVGAERGLVGLVLRPCGPAGEETEALIRAALGGARSGGGRLRVLAGAGVAPGPPGVRALAAEGALELCGLGPERRWAGQLQQLHVAVLPEACGGHSRDLEVCRDVGTRVVAPGCGWFADQWSEVVSYGEDGRGGVDPVSLTGAVAAALARPAPLPADRAWRAEQRAAVRAVHRQVYAQVAADRLWA